MQEVYDTTMREVTKEQNRISNYELISPARLQQLQDEFCQVTRLMAYCLDEKGNRLTHISGEEDKIAYVKEKVSENQIAALLERVEDGSIEEQAVEDMPESDILFGVISVRVDGQAIIYWVIYGISPEVDAIRFYQSVDLLRDASCSLYRNKISCFSAEAESRRSQSAEREMEKNLRTIEATAGIVQLLDSDDPASAIIDRFVNILGNYLQTDYVQLLELYTGGNRMDVLGEWCTAGMVSDFQKTKNITAYSFLDTEVPIVYSSDNIELLKLGMSAVAVFPVLKQEDAGDIFLCLLYKERKHNWIMPEVKFIADTVKMLHSILTRRVQKNSLAGSFEALKAILDNVGCAIYVKDSRTEQMLFANRRLKSTFSKELAEGTFDSLLAQGVPTGRGMEAYEINHIQRERCYDMFCTGISWVDGSRASLISLYDITDKKLYQKRIEQQAYTDFLTGLYNRMCCERDLAWHIDEAKKNQRIGALLYLDLDDFKHINDGLGHQYGDVLLKAISHSFQRVDGINNTCYRMGGDEFVIIIPPRHYEKFDRIIEDIRQIFSKPWFLKDADYYCTMSMGIVTFPDAGETVTDLIKKADIAMYEAKKSGKNRVARYSDNFGASSGRRLDMEKNMRDATVGGYSEFQVYFQPILDIQSSRSLAAGMSVTADGSRVECVGAEALIRWNSPKLGFISPSDFIPLAEYLGLINPIGNHVLSEACRYCKAWNDNGYPDFKVNVNLSVVQLLQTDIVEIVKQTLDETGIRPKNLTLEVTESLAINDMDRMKEILNKIKALGVRIALDDFGTGYSSLNHIREIPFDVIKVDQSFVKDLAEDAYSQSFIKMVAELAETIGVSICVEGIETLDQYKVIQEMKVRLVQGYYFDRPMPREAFEEKYTPSLAKLSKSM